MPEEKVKLIADSADMVVGGYAFTKKDGKIAVLNINNPEYAMVLSIEGKELVVTSGMLADDWDGQIPEDFETEVRHTILACERVLKEAGCGLEHVFNVEVYMRDMAQWSDFNKVYCEMMPDPKPCRKALEVGLVPGLNVEIVMWAVK